MDFPQGQIIINGGSLLWGPFMFDFTNSIPPNDSLSSVRVQTLLGTTDSTSALVSGGYTQVVGNAVSIRFSYPGSTFLGQHRVLFFLTFTSGAEQRFEFDYVTVTV